MSKKKRPKGFYLLEQQQAVVDINKFVLKQSEEKLNELRRKYD